jgi:sulfopyruvate decarboxylase subunit beta
MTARMKRTDCLKILAEHITDQPVVVAVGGLVDEWHHLAPRDLNYFSGGMGLASSVGLGLSLARSETRVVVLDGDGALLMNLGSMATVSGLPTPNLLHLVFDNGTYQSSGGFALPGEGKFRFPAVAEAAGLRNSREVTDLETWRGMVPDLLGMDEHAIVFLKVKKGDRVPFMTADRLALRYRFQEALLQ